MKSKNILILLIARKKQQKVRYFKMNLDILLPLQKTSGIGHLLPPEQTEQALQPLTLQVVFINPLPMTA